MSGFYSQNGVFVPIVAVCQKGPVYARQWYKESLFATIKQVQRVPFCHIKNWDRISVERRVKFRYSSEICNNGGQKRGSKFELEGIWNLLRSLTPIPGNISGRSLPRNNTQCSRSAVGRPLGQRWILGPGLRVGGPGTPPFWRTRKELCTVRNSAR